MSLLLITHDLSIVKKISDRVCVMKDGQIIEQDETKTLFKKPKHPYTLKLINSNPNEKNAAFPLPISMEDKKTNKVKIINTKEEPSPRYWTPSIIAWIKPNEIKPLAKTPAVTTSVTTVTKIFDIPVQKTLVLSIKRLIDLFFV